MLKQAKISARIPEAWKQALQDRAKKEDETEGEVVRMALRAFLFPAKQPQRSGD